MKRLFTILIVAMTAVIMSAQTKKTVIAYFSATGTTEAVAKQLSKAQKAELEGKTVIPFATSGGSGVEKSVSEFKTAYPKVKWQKGLLKN